MYNLKKVVASELSTNCYFIIKDDKCIIFDCGGSLEVLNFLEENKLTPIKVFLTHGHYDHMSGIEMLRTKYNDIEVIACGIEKDLIEDPSKNMSAKFHVKPITLDKVTYINNGDVIDSLGYKIKMILTPGHTSGSCCYYIESEKLLFSGDTLFKETYGRFDLPTGSIKNLVNSVGIELMKLPDDTLVYPGHGKDTSISHERENNELATESIINWAKTI